MLESRLYRETLAAAGAFHARKLWLKYEADDCFAVSVPDEEHPLFACIMGQAGKEFGLILLRGPDACGHLRDMLDRDPRDTDAPDDVAFLAFSMGSYADASPIGRSLLAKARFAGPRSAIVPSFLAKDAGREPRRLTSGEVQTCLYALRGTLKALDAGMLTPTPLRPGGETLTLVVQGDPRDPEVSAQRRRYAPSPLATPSPGLGDDLAGLPRLPSRWLLGFPALPVSIETDDRTVRLVLAADPESEQIVLARAIQGGPSEAVDVVRNAFRGWNLRKAVGLPREITVANRELFNALWPALDAVGVPCRYEPAIPLLDEILESLAGTLPDDDARPPRELDATEDVPAAEDLAGWKLCDQRLYLRARARLADAGGAADRAIARYFGHRETGSIFLDDPDDIFPGMSFFEWVWLDYRATKRSKTLAERMQAGGLPPAERTLLEARVRAVPSVFRVASITRGECLRLLDVLFGGEVTLHDRALSECATEDMCFAARVFPAGAFHFASSLGPPLSPFEVDDALDFLEEQGLRLTEQGTRAKPHLFGRLWAWVDQRRASRGRPHMVNTDGDDLCFHTATYRVRDEASARDALAARGDLDDDDEDTYRWVRRSGRGPTAAFGETLSLGTLRIIGDELLLEVNSAERLEAARAWLDRLPGVELQTVRVRTLDEALEAGVPPDDQPAAADEVPMTPELVARLREMFDQHYMQWLDMPLPMFAGRTPRQMCDTPEGRRKVVRMIRTIPKPVGPAGADVEVPREAMLKALGLDEE